MYREFKRVVLALDLLKISTAMFTQLMELFRTAVELCPVDPRLTLSSQHLIAVDSCLSDMSRMTESCACRIDDSEMASDFALAVIAAGFLLVGRELPKTDPEPTPDIIYREDELPAAKVSFTMDFGIGGVGARS